MLLECQTSVDGSNACLSADVLRSMHQKSIVPCNDVGNCQCQWWQLHCRSCMRSQHEPHIACCGSCKYHHKLSLDATVVVAVIEIQTNKNPAMLPMACI